MCKTEKFAFHPKYVCLRVGRMLMPGSPTAPKELAVSSHWDEAPTAQTPIPGPSNVISSCWDSCGCWVRPLLLNPQRFLMAWLGRRLVEDPKERYIGLRFEIPAIRVCTRLETIHARRNLHLGVVEHLCLGWLFLLSEVPDSLSISRVKPM